VTRFGVRRVLLLASITLIATAVYEMGWLTVTIADGLSGRQKFLAPVLVGSSAPFVAMLGFVVAIVAGGRSRILAVAGFVIAAWVASGAAAPWASRALSDGSVVIPYRTTVSTVVMALLSAGALVLLSVSVSRSTAVFSVPDTAGESS
jgi:hypothetical protein